MMESYLFIVRDPNGKDIHCQEIILKSNLISMAQNFMDVVRAEFPDALVECCEIWTRTEHHTMTLLATAF